MTKNSARFTMVDKLCVRLEYCEDGGFVDAPTLFAANRQARCPEALFSDDENRLVVKTDCLRIEYKDDGKPFHKNNLRILFKHGKETREWMPGMKSVNNLGGTMATLDKVDRAVPLPDGLLARDGWHLLDDSGSPLLVDNWTEQRPKGKNAGFDWYFFGYGHGLAHHAGRPLWIWPRGQTRLDRLYLEPGIDSKAGKTDRGIKRKRPFHSA